MKRKFVVLPVMVLALVLCMGCDNDNGTTNNGTTTNNVVDTSLNGSWVLDPGTELLDEIRFNNGNFEAFEDDMPFQQGTYTTNNGKITMTLTRIYGSLLGLEPRWYTHDELKSYGDDPLLNEMFSPQTSDYSVNGNTFTLTGGGVTAIYTKK